MLSQLEKLFIVQEKLEQLRPRLEELKKEEQPESADGAMVSDLYEYCSSLRHFRKLTLDENNLRGRHEWQILMLMPDDMDELLA